VKRVCKEVQIGRTGKIKRLQGIENKRTEKRRKIIDIFRGLHRERHLQSTKTNTKDVPVQRMGSARFKLVS
jgi:hypothetical protein